MLAVLVPGLLCLIFIRLRGRVVAQVATSVCAVVALSVWFSFVIAHRSSDTIVHALATSNLEDTIDAKHEGLNMFEELCWINKFLEEGTYQPNWGERYYGDLVNCVPRTLWPGKPRIGFDYAIARGFGTTKASDGINASIATGMIGQGVVNFGPWGGPPAAAFLVSLWVAALARFDLDANRLGRLPLYVFGLALTFNLGRDVTLLVAYPLLFGYLLVHVLDRLIEAAAPSVDETWHVGRRLAIARIRHGASRAQESLDEGHLCAAFALDSAALRPGEPLFGDLGKLAARANRGNPIEQTPDGLGRLCRRYSLLSRVGGERRRPQTHHFLGRLSRIPILDRRMLKEHAAAFRRSSGPPDNFVSTGGSTGQPVRIGQWRQEPEVLRIAKLVPWIRCGYAPGDTIYLIWGHAHLLGSGWRRYWNHAVRKLKDRMLGYHCANAYTMDAEKAIRIAQDIIRRRPCGLIGYAAVLDLLERHTATYHEALRRANLRFVMSCAEPPPRPDTFDRLRRAFACPILQEFGGVDFGHVATKTDDEPFRVFPDLNVLEAAPAGGDGRPGQCSRHDAVPSLHALDPLSAGGFAGRSHAAGTWPRLRVRRLDRPEQRRSGTARRRAPCIAFPSCIASRKRTRFSMFNSCLRTVAPAFVWSCEAVSGRRSSCGYACGCGKSTRLLAMLRSIT